jgi:hypothetical protein
VNSLRIRVVQLSKHYGVGDDHAYAVQVSTCGLVWWTLNRFKTFDEALGPAKALEEFVKKNFIVQPTHVLWKTQI